MQEVYYSNRYIPQYSQIYVSLGINKVFEDSFKPYVFINLKNPLIIEEENVNSVGITIHNFDPTSAPFGKTVLTILIPIKYTESWINLRKKNKTEYEKKKEEIARHMIKEIDAYFGDIKTKVEMIDVATPATYIRYTNNWNGGADSMSWGTDIRWAADGTLIVNKPKKEITGLNNFFMCGQWVGDIGLSEGMQSGKDVAQILCKCEGKQFKVIAADKGEK